MSVATEHFAYPLVTVAEAPAVRLKPFAEMLVGGAVLAAFVWIVATAWLFGMLVGWL
jgi:hypothetical protein